MYLAEIHGKLSKENENKEDILTSNVFSFFKYADRKVFLLPLLVDLLGFDISEVEAKNAEFSFWPRYEDSTEPDLVIVVGKYYLLFEAKYRSGFGGETDRLDSQLVREIINGKMEAKNLGKRFKLIAVTAYHFFKPEIIKDIPEEYYEYFQWINWQQITLLLRRILDSIPLVTVETYLFADDLYKLLVRKGLRDYEGISLLSLIPKLKECPQDIFFQAVTASYRGDFIGFYNVLRSCSVKVPLKMIFYGDDSRVFNSLIEMTGNMQKKSGNIFFKEIIDG